jgi:hypothetical protein
MERIKQVQAGVVIALELPGEPVSSDFVLERFFCNAASGAEESR